MVTGFVSRVARKDSWMSCSLFSSGNPVGAPGTTLGKWSWILKFLEYICFGYSFFFVSFLVTPSKTRALSLFQHQRRLKRQPWVSLKILGTVYFKCPYVFLRLTMKNILHGWVVSWPYMVLHPNLAISLVEYQPRERHFLYRLYALKSSRFASFSGLETAKNSFLVNFNIARVTLSLSVPVLSVGAGRKTRFTLQKCARTLISIFLVVLASRVRQHDPVYEEVHDPDPVHWCLGSRDILYRRSVIPWSFTVGKQKFCYLQMVDNKQQVTKDIIKLLLNILILF